MTFVRTPRSSVFAAQVWPVARGMAAGFVAGLQRRRGPGADDLEEARELLAYWERRARRLPRWSVLRRREAREMARVWRGRVADAERLRYGKGMLGAAALYATERRLPATVAHRGHQAVRVAAWTAFTVMLAVLVLVVSALVAIVDAVAGAL
ncbi:MAG TPA: hypothetical protein VN213_05910 [Solirubrobacteraceae bacterium]|nr:hypothetical protein [Solirubrobacteraceae bacterium]